jgi:hypothetical protein
MLSRRYGSFHILATAAIALSAGCAGGGSAPTTPGSVTAHVQSIARAANMIAVSGTENSDVGVFDPSGHTLADLSGFNYPQGLASDIKGNLYVADTINSRIQIYPPGFKGKPTTLSDPGQYPMSLDTFDNGKVVAVVNQYTTSYGQGSVTIYTNGVAGTPITSPAISQAFFAAFDAKGNLYVDFSPKSGKCPCVAKIADAAKGGTKLAMLRTSNSISPAGIRVTNTGQIAILDYGNTVYTYNPPAHGSLGSPVATTVLDGVGTSGAFAFTRDMKDLYTVNYNDNGTVFEYAYPAGGGNVFSFDSGGSYPFGVAVFPAQYPRK